jgi:Zn-dependent protease with chaperone function
LLTRHRVGHFSLRFSLRLKNLPRRWTSTGQICAQFLQKHRHMTNRALPNALIIAVLLVPVTLAQTRIVPPKNKYPVTQDVQLGREAADQARAQLPMLRDDAVSSYVEELGRRLVNAIPPELEQNEFKYSFETVNVRDINAFALPGGPMFVNRGMIEAARTEGEVAGVMAHEISHVVLRHGTAQASKATKYQAGQIAGAILGAIVGGGVGSAIAQGTQFGLGAAFLRFGREYEKQADLEGAQIMARAGYDPRDMANMFKTIEQTAGKSGPEWLSDHPNPGNRSEYIAEEARALRVENVSNDSARFDRVKAHLQSLPKAPTSQEAARSRSSPGSSSTGPSRPPTGNVAPPSSRFTQYTIGRIFKVSVPANWRQSEGSSAVTFAPEGAYGTIKGQGVFTHGIEFGVSRTGGQGLDAATRELVDSLAQGNPRMKPSDDFRPTSIGGRDGLRATLQNVSEVTGDEERVQVLTTKLDDGSLFYAVAVAPEAHYDSYSPAFQRAIDSLRFGR